MPRAPGSGGNAESPGLVAAAAALTQVGVPYRFGGRSPKGSKNPGWDCSGLVSWAWHEAGKLIPPTTFTEWPAMRPITKSQLQTGDLLFYIGSDGTSIAPGHVVMYLGGGRIIQAARTGTRVATRDVFWTGYVGARRPWGVPQAPGGGNGTTGGTAGGSPFVKCLPGGGCPAGYVVFPSWGLAQLRQQVPNGIPKGNCLCVQKSAIQKGGLFSGLTDPLNGISGFFGNLPRYLEIFGGGVVLIGGILVAIFGANPVTGGVVGAAGEAGGSVLARVKKTPDNIEAPTAREREVAIRLMNQRRLRGRPIGYNRALQKVQSTNKPTKKEGAK